MLFVSTLMLLTLPAFGADAPKLAGKWNIHQSIAGNESDSECTLIVNDNKITGECKSEDKSNPIEGTIDGNKVTWTLTGEFNGAPLKLEYKSTVDSADKFSGTVDVHPFEVSGEFTATAVK